MHYLISGAHACKLNRNPRFLTGENCQETKMVLDIELFRADKGGDPAKLKENQAKRFADVTLVDRVIEHDTAWRKGRRSGWSTRTLVNSYLFFWSTRTHRLVKS